MNNWKSKFRLRYKGIFSKAVEDELIKFMEQIPCELCEQFKEEVKLLKCFRHREEIKS